MIKKKIVFVIESLHLGGAEKSLVTLLQNFDYNKYDVDLIIFNKDGFFNDFVPKEVNQIIVEHPKLSCLDRLKFAIKRKTIKNFHAAQLFWPIISNYFKVYNNNYDIAIAYNQGFATYYVDSFIKANIKYAWLNVDYQKAGYNINFDFNFYNNYNKIVAVSAEAKQGLINALNSVGKELDITIIKDITDKQIVLQQSEIKPEIAFIRDKINLVTVCRLAKAKGLNLLLEAAQLLVVKAYPINWFIVGEGSERVSLERDIKRLNLEDNVFLLGATPNPYPYMKAADIYVQTSLFEGLGLTVIEASYLDKAIVCTNFPTAHGIIKHEETGLICEMNAESIADSIERILSDESLKNKLTSNLSNQKDTDKEVTLRQINTLIV